MSALKKVNSFNILKMDISDVSATPGIVQFITSKITYIREIIQNTILSIKLHRVLEIFSDNDTKLSITVLTELFEQNENILCEMTRTPLTLTTDAIIDSLQRIIDKLAMIICGFGTTHISDLLFIIFGTKFKNTVPTHHLIHAKYRLLMKHVRPTSYKIIHWKQGYLYTPPANTVCCNKKTDSPQDLSTVGSFECFDIDHDPKNIFQRTNGIRVIIQNERERKTLVINGVLDDIHVECIRTEYVQYRISTLNACASNYTDDDKTILLKIIDNLTLKELLVYGDTDIIKKVNDVNVDIKRLKQTNMEALTKHFLELDIYTQRCMLLNLLLYVQDKEVEYTCYLLYDLLNSASGYSVNHQEAIYNSFPWKIRNQMKDIVKYNINHVQEIIHKYEGNKISLEQQICLMKAPDSVKEKAMAKLKDLKGRPDEFGVKIRQFLEGLVRIPFGICKEEPILSAIKHINADFKSMCQTIARHTPTTIAYTKQTYTLLEISNAIKNMKKSTYNHVLDLINSKIQKWPVAVLNTIIKMLEIKHDILSTVLKLDKRNKVEYIIKSLHNQESTDFFAICKIFNEIPELHETTSQITHMHRMTKMENSIIQFHEGSALVEKALDDSIYSHTHAKKQIMKIIGQWMNGEQTGYCFGFEGSPGIGKTSLAKKGLTKCLVDVNGEPRPFAFIAIGGSSSGSALEGHGYTYVNSTWGRIVDILMETKCMNPIIYIDELDKVSNTEAGKDIIGILTHLIDPTQNESFQDKYFAGIDIDISKALFIFSYNDAALIDRILLDRIHRIKFENLTLDDKMVIVRKYILPDINKKMGFDETVEMSDAVVEHIINCYTCEPGVRKLKEIIFDLYGEINLELIKSTNKTELTIPIVVTIENLENKYLTKYQKISEKKIYKEPRVGIINGLWANALGMGGIIPIQTSFYPSSVFLDLQLTGLQGDVMKESMNVAKTLAWSLTCDSIKKDLLQYFESTKCQGLHIHCPDGSISKDGPSAGAAITTAIYSLLNKKHIKNDVAITGEINLSGEITAIGGLDVKISNGIRAGVKTFLYPQENHRDFSKWQKKCTTQPQDIKFIAISTITEVFTHVFANDNITL
jgi:ATP-dependent Lon protease